MYKAHYVTNGTTSLISPKDICSRKDYKEVYNGNLYCPTIGCEAQLDYVELPFWGHSKIFRTHKGSEHASSCPYCITHAQTNGPIFSSETFSQSISTEHIKSVLKGLYQRNTNPFSGGTGEPRKGGVTKHKSDDEQMTIRGRAVASISPDAEPASSGTREPSVRKKRSQDLFSEDNNKLRGIDGTVENGSIGDNYVELNFSSTGQPVSLLFYNAFKDKSTQAYRYVQELVQLLNSTNLHVLVCCLGVVEVKDDKVQIQIMDPEYITIEGLSINNYMNLQVS